MTDPMAVATAQIDLFYNTLGIWQKTAQRMLMLRAREADAPRDIASSIRTGARMLSSTLRRTVISLRRSRFFLQSAKSKAMDEAARKVYFYTRQFVDALSPSNFVTTNPEVLIATLESGGQNLLRGLENLLADLERRNGRLVRSSLNG
jgi:polyhydroxyalkanoate synthase subunit PhaC